MEQCSYEINQDRRFHYLIIRLSEIRITNHGDGPETYSGTGTILNFCK